MIRPSQDRLAAEIRKIRHRLTSPDTLNNPRVSIELHELYKSASTGNGRAIRRSAQ